jgi:1-acyl-sn-glycerol-3-phosphate acyltransferase
MRRRFAQWRAESGEDPSLSSPLAPRAARRHRRALPSRWAVWEPVRVIRRILIRWCYRPIIRIWLRGFVIEGGEHIPPGPVIYAAMHTSMADTPLLLWALGSRSGRTLVTAARDFFFRRSRPGFGPLVALAFGAVPINRTGAARESLNDAITWLRNGYSLIIYPQGTIPARSEDERSLHRGVALLARGASCPVIPVRIAGAADLLPAGVHWPRRASVHIIFLPALRYIDIENITQFTARLSRSLFFRNDVIE